MSIWMIRMREMDIHDRSGWDHEPSIYEYSVCIMYPSDIWILGSIEMFLLQSRPGVQTIPAPGVGEGSVSWLNMAGKWWETHGIWGRSYFQTVLLVGSLSDSSLFDWTNGWVYDIWVALRSCYGWGYDFHMLIQRDEGGHRWTIDFLKYRSYDWKSLWSSNLCRSQVNVRQVRHENMVGETA